MDVFLLYHISHTGNADGVHRQDGEVRIDEQAGDVVKLLGCYSSEERAKERIGRARLLPGFGNEPECFTISRSEVDRGEWTEGYVVVTN
jgi:hypothetical protein